MRTFASMKLKETINKLSNTLFRAVRRYDLGKYEYEPKLSRPVYGVYHIYCDKGWQNMVNDQVSHLKASGLLDATTKFYISCIAKDSDEADELLRIINSDKAELISVTTDPSKFEYPALSFLHRKSMAENCFLYYFHTKGISYQAVGDTDKRFNKFKRNIESWRKMMEYFIFDKWQVAVNTLSSGYDTYGCYRLPPPPTPYYLYAGNFWWSRSEYLRHLPMFSTEQLHEGRFYAEEWLYSAGPKDFSAFDCMADLYFVNMPRAIYADKRQPLLLTAAFVLKYNWHKFRKHILHYDYNAEYKQRYQRLAGKKVRNEE